MEQIFMSASALCIATMIGAVIGFAVKELPHKWNDAMLGYCAGIMLAASVMGLIVPALEMCSLQQSWSVAAGVAVGAIFLNLLDWLTPHLHHVTGLDIEEHTHNSRINRILLFVMAIALHKFPEGMAAGVSMGPGTDSGNSWMVTFGLALQNIPEGMVIVPPLILAGVSTLRTILISLAIGLLEVVGVWAGFALGAISNMLLPAMLGFAGGAMLYVTSDEMIPETHAHGYQKQATYALLAGFMTLLLVEKAFE